MSKSVYIKADSREDNGALPALPNAIEVNNMKFSKLPQIELIEGQMTIGDYSIVFQSNLLESHYITGIIFERKTWKDLAASIKDPRMERQYKNMINAADKLGCQIYYIIEGEIKGGAAGRMDASKLRAKIRRNMLRGVPYIRTKNQIETAELLVDMARDMHRLYCDGELSFPKQEGRCDIIYDPNDMNALLEKYKDTPMYAEFVRLQNIMKAEDAIDTCTNPSTEIIKPTPLNNTEIEMEMWRTFKGVGGELANGLASKYTIKKLFIDRPDLHRADIVMPNGRKPSRNTLENIMVSMTDISHQAKMLSCIKGVTLDAAMALLMKVTIENILTGTLDVDAAKKIEYTTKSGKMMKLGFRVDRILEVFVDNEDW